MLSELQNGNVVQTSGGIVGTIVTINSNDDTLVIRVKPDNSNCRSRGVPSPAWLPRSKPEIEAKASR